MEAEAAVYRALLVGLQRRDVDPFDELGSYGPDSDEASPSGR
jgi:hypothetical protein